MKNTSPTTIKLLTIFLNNILSTAIHSLFLFNIIQIYTNIRHIFMNYIQFIIYHTIPLHYTSNKNNFLIEKGIKVRPFPPFSNTFFIKLLELVYFK